MNTPTGHNTPPADTTLCFLVSAPRSGSTWLKEALNAHPEVFCTENRLFGRHYDLVSDDGRAQPRLRITLDRYVDSLIEPYHVAALNISPPEARQRLVTELARTLISFGRRASGRRLIVDKITPYLHTADDVLRQIDAVFPEARLIHLVRDGRDVAVSGVFHWMTKTIAGAQRSERALDRRRIFIRGKEPGAFDRFFDDEEIEEWAALWRQPIDAVGRRGGRPAMLTVRYEHLIADQAGELRRIFDYLGAASDPRTIARCARASAFERMSGGRRRGETDPTAHVRKGIVGDWRNYFTRRDGERFHAAAGARLMQLGYADDEHWFEHLPDRLSPPRAGRGERDVHLKMSDLGAAQ